MTALRYNARIRLAAVSALGLTLALAPFSAPLATGDSIIASAYAKGGGGGGGGSGGGNGNGNGNGNGGAASNSDGRGNANGHDKNSNSASEDSGKTGPGKSGASGQAGRDKSDKDKSDPAAKGAVSADLGKLNAAHASPTALSRAAPNSTPGMIGAYKDAVIAGMTPAEAEKALSDISNKSVNRDVVNAVNDLLGISFSSPPAATN